MINPILTLLVIPFLANGKNFDAEKFEEIISVIDNLNDYSDYMSRKNNRGYNRGYIRNNKRYLNNYSFRGNSGYRNNYRNGGINNKEQRNFDSNSSGVLKKIIDFLNELNGE